MCVCGMGGGTYVFVTKSHSSFNLNYDNNFVNCKRRMIDQALTCTLFSIFRSTVCILLDDVQFIDINLKYKANELICE